MTAILAILGKIAIPALLAYVGRKLSSSAKVQRWGMEIVPLLEPAWKAIEAWRQKSAAVNGQRPDGKTSEDHFVAEVRSWLALRHKSKLSAKEEASLRAWARLRSEGDKVAKLPRNGYTPPKGVPILR